MAGKPETGGRRPASICFMKTEAVETVRKVVEKFGTRDVSFIAANAGVKIVYENWYPVTAGEFDKGKRTISVNLRAVATGNFSEKSIIAHELGHFFAGEFCFDRKTEEAFADLFAKELNSSE